MFDIGFLELVLVGIVALLVLGPERLPHAARMTGAFLGRMSRMVQSVRDEVEREINIHEMQQRIKKQVEDGMIGDLRKELGEAQQAIQEGFNASSKSPAKPDHDEAADDQILIEQAKLASTPETSQAPAPQNIPAPMSNATPPAAIPSSTTPPTATPSPGSAAPAVQKDPS